MKRKRFAYLRFTMTLRFLSKVSLTSTLLIALQLLQSSAIAAPIASQGHRWVMDLPPDDLQVSRLSPRDGRIYVATYYNRIHVVNPYTERREYTIEVPGSGFAITDINFSPDGRYLAVSGNGVWIYDTQTHQGRSVRLGSRDPQETVRSVAFLDDSTRLLVPPIANGLPPEVIDATTGQVLQTVQNSNVFSTQRILTDAKRMSTFIAHTGSTNAEFVKLDVAHSPVTNIGRSAFGDIGEFLNDYAIDPSGRNLFTACGAPYEVRQVDTTSLQVTRIFPTTNYPHAVSVSPSGGWMYSTSSAGGNSPSLYAFSLRPNDTTSARFPLDSLASSPYPQLRTSYWSSTERGIASSADSAKVFVSTGESFDWDHPMTDQIQIVDMADRTPNPVLAQSINNGILSPAQGYTDNNQFPLFSGDFNGDGRQDFGRIHGNGTVIYASLPGGQTVQQIANVPNLFSPSAGYLDDMRDPLIAGDWNGDGLTDIARVGATKMDFMTSNRYGFSWMTSINDLSRQQGYTDRKTYPLLVGDWNGDGKDDFARVHGNGILVFLSDGARFRLVSNLADLSPAQGYADDIRYPLIVGDWNRDGRMDFARVGGSAIRFYFSNADGTPKPYTSLSALTPAQGFTDGETYPIRVGDFNGDGRSDIARVTGSGVALFLSGVSGFTQGTPVLNFSPAQGYTNNSTYPLLAEDINGDGITDLVRVHGNGILVALGNGTTFYQIQNIGQGSPAQGYANLATFPMVTGDFNGDGKKGFARIHGSGIVSWEIR